jgi:hypothetical protein
MGRNIAPSSKLEACPGYPQASTTVLRLEPLNSLKGRGILEAEKDRQNATISLTPVSPSHCRLFHQT